MACVAPPQHPWYGQIDLRRLQFDVLLIELLGAFVHQPVEVFRIRPHFACYTGEGAGEVAEFVGPRADFGETCQIGMQVLEPFGGCGDLHDRRGDLPGHVTPADAYGAQDADHIQEQQQFSAALYGLIRCSYRFARVGFYLCDQLVDLCGQYHHPGTCLLDKGVGGLLFEQQLALRRKDAEIALAKIGQGFGGVAERLDFSSRNKSKSAGEPVICRSKALAQRLQQGGVRYICGICKQSADQVAFDAELRNRCVVQQRGSREALAGRSRLRIVERAISGDQIESLVIEQRGQQLDQPAMIVGRAVGPDGKHLLQLKLPRHREVELVEYGGQLIAGRSNGIESQRCCARLRIPGRRRESNAPARC